MILSVVRGVENAMAKVAFCSDKRQIRQVKACLHFEKWSVTETTKHRKEANSQRQR